MLDANMTQSFVEGEIRPYADVLRHPNGRFTNFKIYHAGKWEWCDGNNGRPNLMEWPADSPEGRAIIARRLATRDEEDRKLAEMAEKTKDDPRGPIHEGFA